MKNTILCMLALMVPAALADAAKPKARRTSSTTKAGAKRASGTKRAVVSPSAAGSGKTRSATGRAQPTTLRKLPRKYTAPSQKQAEQEAPAEGDATLLYVARNAKTGAVRFGNSVDWYDGKCISSRASRCKSDAGYEISGRFLGAACLNAWMKTKAAGQCKKSAKMLNEVEYLYKKWDETSGYPVIFSDIPNKEFDSNCILKKASCTIEEYVAPAEGDDSAAGDSQSEIKQAPVHAKGDKVPYSIGSACLHGWLVKQVANTCVLRSFDVAAPVRAEKIAYDSGENAVKFGASHIWYDVSCILKSEPAKCQITQFDEAYALGQSVNAKCMNAWLARSESNECFAFCAAGGESECGAEKSAKSNPAATQ
jgi:hypothetical protein